MKSDTIIISIHPVFVEKILSGEKKYEYRKRFPKGVRYMLVYSTSPIKKITALIEIDSVLCDTPQVVWRKTKEHAGVTRDFFAAYFNGRPKAYAVKFKKIQILNRPLLLSHFNRIKAVPQSYVYLKEDLDIVIDSTLYSLRISNGVIRND